MKTFLFFLAAISSGTLHADDAVFTSAPAPVVSGRTLWRASIAALATANALDIHSSWGKHELNPALASPPGNFGREGALIKLGLQGGLMAAEYLIIRKHPSGKLYRALSVINFGASAAIAGVAVHNYAVPRLQ